MTYCRTSSACKHATRVQITYTFSFRSWVLRACRYFPCCFHFFRTFSSVFQCFQTTDAVHFAFRSKLFPSRCRIKTNRVPVSLGEFSRRPHGPCAVLLSNLTSVFQNFLKKPVFSSIEFLSLVHRRKTTIVALSENSEGRKLVNISVPPCFSRYGLIVSFKAGQFFSDKLCSLTNFFIELQVIIVLSESQTSIYVLFGEKMRLRVLDHQ